MQGRWLSFLSLVALALVALVGGALLTTRAAAANPNKVDARVLADTANGQSAHFLVVLAEQADLSGAAALQGKEAKGAFVTQALREVAARTQPAVTAQLDALGLRYRAYWVTNMISVEGDRSAVDALVANAAIARIEPNRAIRMEEPLQAPAGAPSSPAAPEWGVAKIRAPEVWDMGYTGQDIVVANQDTGHDWDHPALINQYRGWDGATADHNYNWWDAIHEDIDGASNPCGLDSPVPCDDNGHGTHTVGTQAGDDGANNQIGVAPGSRWIGCRNMDAGTGRPSTYTECFQFFLAPTDLDGNNPDPTLAPAVISNSWGCPIPGEECVVDSFVTVIENLRAAGIMVVVSAGNAGPACGTVLAPPSYHDASTSVGATSSNDNIASFSSRGPATQDGSNRLKPDISAPGVGVRSALPGGGYGSLSGTSMAAPHVAGAAALLWSARPSLLGDVDATEEALLLNAVPRTTSENCGGVPGSEVPNNTYGYGRLDILAAVEATEPPTAVTVTGLGSAATLTPWLAAAPLALLAGAGLLALRLRKR